MTPSIRTLLTRIRRRSAPDPPAPAEIADPTRLAARRTRLASERSFLAAERTLMAWIRTALSMISFGFTMVKFIEYLKDQGTAVVGLAGRTVSANAVGFTLVVIGTASLVVAILQHRTTLRMLHAEGLRPRWSLALTVATVVAILGVFAFAGLWLHY